MKKIGFIGAGNMAEAIIKGIVSKNLFSKQDIFISDVDKNRLNFINNEYGAIKAKDNLCLVNSVDIIVIAVKPQNAEEVLEGLRSANKEGKLFISIMAGKKISWIKSFLGNKISVIRVMPNTPALLGYGMSSLVKDNCVCCDESFKIIKEIFKAIGEIIEVDEDKIDIVTALSGSGPAYLFLLAEAMIESGTVNGLSEKQASLLTAQTILGAGQMLKMSSDSAKKLREKVTSKGGTTEAALDVFNKENWTEIVFRAILAAKKRSIQL